jgi:hypothetical protein
MGVMNTVVNAQAIAEKYRLLYPFLNERTRRLRSAIEAKTLGRGGIHIRQRLTCWDKFIQ